MPAYENFVGNLEKSYGLQYFMVPLFAYYDVNMWIYRLIFQFLSTFMKHLFFYFSDQIEKRGQMWWTR